MKVGILYICTGKYDKYFDDFFLSSEKFFLINHEKKYYVFTDSVYLNKKYQSYKNIEFIYQRRLWWPLDTLMRFWMFKWAENKLQNEDFLLFCNANLIFLKEIKDSEFLPNGTSEKLIGVLHWWFYSKVSALYPYERNKKSTAYISFLQRWKYFYWWLNGGFMKEYFELIDTCIKNISIDLSTNYIAKWHDESHLNRYFLGRNDIKVLDSSYLYPEWSNLPFEPKILLKDKTVNGKCLLREV